MQLARVEGNITATVKHPSFQGWRLLICQPVGSAGDAFGSPVVAIDPYGAGLHETVVVSTDGKAARRAVNDEKSPVRHMIVAIVDRRDAVVSPASNTPTSPPDTQPSPLSR